jgi:hypothetical protein
MVRNSTSWGRREEKGYMMRWGVSRRAGEGLPCNVAEGNHNQVIVVGGKRWMDGTNNSSQISGGPEVTFCSYHIRFDLWGQISKANAHFLVFFVPLTNHSPSTLGRPPKFVEDTSDEEPSDKENTGNACGVKRKAVELGSASGSNIGGRPKRKAVAPDRLNF